MIGLVVALIAFGGYCGYGSWRKHHLAAQAQDFFDQKDYQSAVLVARHLLQLDPKNIAACRIVAETAELAGKREALSWREQVVALDPSDPANRIALANAAMRFGQSDLARKTLDAVAASGRANLKYHELNGALAIAEKNKALAETEFAAALELAPNDPQLALNLATLRLTSSESATREKARTDLARFVQQNSLRVDALRALTADALANKSSGAAEKWATQLRAEKGATFADLLLYVEASRKNSGDQNVLFDAETNAARSPATAAALITWMNRHEMAQAARDWALSLPAEILSADRKSV